MDSARVLGENIGYSLWENMHDVCLDTPDGRVVGTTIDADPATTQHGMGLHTDEQTKGWALFSPEVFYDRPDTESNIVALVFFGGDADSAAAAFPIPVPPRAGPKSSQRRSGDQGVTAQGSRIVNDGVAAGSRLPAAAKFSCIPGLAARKAARGAGRQAVETAARAASAIREGNRTNCAQIILEILGEMILGRRVLKRAQTCFLWLSIFARLLQFWLKQLVWRQPRCRRRQGVQRNRPLPAVSRRNTPTFELI
jgi:hypothetical protein